MQINRKQLRYIYNRFTFTRPSFAYYPVNSATPGKRATYGEARVGIMTNGAAGIMVEPGTTNLIPYSDPTDLAQIPSKGNISIAPAGSVGAAFAGGVAFGAGVEQCAYFKPALQPATTYTLSVFVRMDDGGVPVPDRISTSGDFALILDGRAIDPANITIEGLGAGLYRVSGYRTVGDPLYQINTGIIKYATQSARTFKVTGFDLEPGDQKTSYMATNGAAATRSPEIISAPVLFTPQEGGEISFRVEVTDRTKLQDGIRRLLVVRNAANTQNSLSLYHRSDSAQYHLATTDDAGLVTGVNFADTLIPNGTRILDVIHDKAIPAVILKCDGNEIARITNPALPSGWGRAYLGSDAAGKNHADAMFGGIKMTAADSTVLSDILFNGPDFIRKARTIQL